MKSPFQNALKERRGEAVTRALTQKLLRRRSKCWACQDWDPRDVDPACALHRALSAVDEVQPLVSDLAAALSRVATPCPGGRAALERWLVALNGLRAAEEIDEGQARQLSFDLDAAYAEFHRGLRDADR